MSFARTSSSGNVSSVPSSSLPSDSSTANLLLEDDMHQRFKCIRSRPHGRITMCLYDHRQVLVRRSQLVADVLKIPLIESLDQNPYISAKIKIWPV
jgi:hypothetical protein